MCFCICFVNDDDETGDVIENSIYTHDVRNVLTNAESEKPIGSMSNTCLRSSYMVSISLFYYHDLNKHKYLSIDFSMVAISFHSVSVFVCIVWPRVSARAHTYISVVCLVFINKMQLTNQMFEKHSQYIQLTMRFHFVYNATVRMVIRVWLNGKSLSFLKIYIPHHIQLTYIHSFYFFSPPVSSQLICLIKSSSR